MSDSNTGICPNCEAKVKWTLKQCDNCGEALIDNFSMEELDWGDHFHNNGKYQRAIIHYNKVLKHNPFIYQAWYYKGISLACLDKYNDALICFEKAIEINPNRKELWQKRGLMLVELNNKEEALRSYEKVLEFDPNDINALNNKGVLLMRLDNLEEALPYFDKVLKINPSFVDAFHFKTEILKSFETVNNSKWLDEIIVLKDKPFTYRTEANLGEIQLHPESSPEFKDFMGGLWFALDLEHLVIEIENFNKKGALVKMYKKDFVKSRDANKRVKFLEALIKKVPNNIKIWQMLEDHYFRLKKIHHALKCDEKIVVLDPDDDYGWARLGSLQLAWGDLSNAKSSFENALKLNQNDDEVINPLSVVYEYLGERELAIETVMKYLKKHPNDNFKLERLENLKTGKSTSLGFANRSSKIELRNIFQRIVTDYKDDFA